MMRTKQIRRKAPAIPAGEVPEPQVENAVAEAPLEGIQEAPQGVTTVADVPNQPDVPSVPDAAPKGPRKRSKRQTQTQAE